MHESFKNTSHEKLHFLSTTRSTVGNLCTLNPVSLDLDEEVSHREKIVSSITSCT
jgi:hypothetical protein